LHSFSYLSTNKTTIYTNRLQVVNRIFVNRYTLNNFDEWLIGFKQQLETEIQVLEKDIARFRKESGL